MYRVPDETIVGNETIEPSRIRHMKSTDYMLLYLKSAVPRGEREKMYRQMVRHGIQCWNDELTEIGLKGLLIHVLKRRENKNDDPADVLDVPWNEEKDNITFDQVPTVLDLIEDILISENFYTRQNDAHSVFEMVRYRIDRFPKTWKLIIRTVSYWFSIKRNFGEKKGLYTEPNIKAFKLYCVLGDSVLLRIARNKNCRYSTLQLLKARGDVIADLRETLKNISLEDIDYWLKNHGEIMPKDIKETFMVQHVKQGGGIKLTE